ncbi:hypothetical protein [Adonisia turfae]|uniref:Uncharacterized protein n=1 Tax=Adonisia turfae CCMR0081 TaxID=2292702 RepID=A0A6M0RL41_9CYAN|nr:hypothetical protein [Adonisia turfae]NEZ56869.1 hypothetical protein [Adonisia turfae CCMR0081]
MTNTNTQVINENFQSIKAEGGRRTQKIGDILKSAFSEAISEVKEGASTVHPLAKDLADNAVQVVKEKGQEAYVNAKQAAQETATDEKDIVTQFKLKLQAIVEAIKATLLGKVKTADDETAAETVKLIEQETEVQTVVTVGSTAA